MRINISEKIELTSVQQKAWEETLTLFSWDAPAFTHILYDMLNPDGGRAVATFLGPNKVPSWFIAGTNGKRLFLIAERFFDLDLKRRIFILAHEVAHPMLGHIVSSSYYRQRGYIQVGFKKLAYNHMLANWAQDFVINDMLVQSRIGTFVEGGCLDDKIGGYKDSWIDVYERLLKECKRNGSMPEDEGEGSGNQQTRRSSKGRQQGSFDFHAGLGEGEPDPNDEHVELGPDEPVSEQQLQDELERARQAAAAAVELARARGKLPAALEMMAEKVLEPVIDWSDHLKSQFARKLGTGGYDFRRPDRRLITRNIIAPGRVGFRAETIIMGADSSGSIYAVPHLISRWMAECSGVLEDVRPREIHVVWCDAEIKRVDIIEDAQDLARMFYKGAKGGGGTDFTPVFEYADNLNREIDCMAYLTDGDGTFPNWKPRYPVIWGSILRKPEHFPFGDVVMIPVPAQ
jgi:predicted metal-dependent peptidase